MSTGGVGSGGRALHRTETSRALPRDADLAQRAAQRPATRTANLARTGTTLATRQVHAGASGAVPVDSFVTAAKTWQLKSLFLKAGVRMLTELREDQTLSPQQQVALGNLRSRWAAELETAVNEASSAPNEQMRMNSDSDMEAICPRGLPKQLYREAAHLLDLSSSQLTDAFRDSFIRTTNDQIPWKTIQSDIVTPTGDKFKSTLTPVNAEFDAEHFAKYGVTGLSSNAPRLTQFDAARFEDTRATNLWHTKYAGPDGTELFSAFRSGCLGAKGANSTERTACARENAREVLTAMILQELKKGNATDPLDVKVCSINLQSGGVIGGEGAMIKYQREGLRNAVAEMNQNGVDITRNGKTEHLNVNVKLVQVRAASNHVGFSDKPGQKRANRTAYAELANEMTSPHVSQRAQDLWAAVERTGKGTTGGFKLGSRVAMLAHELGYQVHFNCMSGKDRTGLMDVECKLLAHRLHEADNAGVNVGIPFDISTDAHRELFNKLLFEGGSQMVTEHNTGIQAYKVDPGNFVEEPVTGLYTRLGGSSEARSAALGGTRYTYIDSW